jgi:hypothetical protein
LTRSTKPSPPSLNTSIGDRAQERPPKPMSAIFTVLPEARVLGTSSKVGTLATAVYQLIATLTSAAGATVTNVGFWTASSAGTLVIHADHGNVVLAAADKIEYTLQIDPS